MNLQEKYKNYKTPLDEEAWSQFQQLRKNKKDNEKGGYLEMPLGKKPHEKKFRWLLLSMLLLLGLGAFLYFGYDTTSVNEWSKQNQTSKDTPELIPSNTKKPQELGQKTSSSSSENRNDVSTSAETTSQQITPTKEEETINERKKTGTASSRNEKKDITTTKPKSLKNQKEVNRTSLAPTHDLNKFDKKGLNAGDVLPTNHKQSNPKTKNTESLPLSSLATEKANNSNIESVKIKDTQKNKELIGSPTIETLSAYLATETDDSWIDSILLFAKPITKTTRQHSKKNHLKISGAYADYYVNGIILTENKIDKKGQLFQVEYSRNLNSIIGIGTSLGYSRGEDTNNPQLDTLDYERIRYAHLNLYLYLLNTPNYRLNLKVGSGITQTKRQHSFFIIELNEPPRRGLQINNLTDFGFLAEGSLERRIYKDIWLGITYGAITHNDGAWYAGLSLGYNF